MSFLAKPTLRQIARAVFWSALLFPFIVPTVITLLNPDLDTYRSADAGCFSTLAAFVIAAISGVCWLFAAYPGPQRYPLTSHQGTFWTGRCDDGNLAIMGRLGAKLALYRFSARGEWIDRQMRPALPTTDAATPGNSATFEPLENQLAAWQSELGFAEKLIKVQYFHDPELDVGMEAPPQGDGSFVFRWGQRFCVTRNGEVQPVLAHAVSA